MSAAIPRGVSACHPQIYNHLLANTHNSDTLLTLATESSKIPNGPRPLSLRTLRFKPSNTNILVNIENCCQKLSKFIATFNFPEFFT